MVRIAMALLLVFTAFESRAVDDPAATGPFAVSRDTYEVDEFEPEGLSGPTEVVGVVHYPANLTSGPFPLVVMLHGAVAWFCYSGSTVYTGYLPCPSGYLPIPHHEGYDYIGSTLASHGFIVVSIRAIGINNYPSSENGDASNIQSRAELIQHHLGLWKTWSTTGDAPFSNEDLFVNKIDWDRVGTMGHSRAGEAVVRHVLWNEEHGSPYDIKAVLALAPTDNLAFLAPALAPLYDPEGELRLALNDVAIGALAGSCDGDTEYFQGVHYLDNTRYDGNTAPRHFILATGANHNYFNTVWTPGGPESPDLPGGYDDAQFNYQDDPICGDEGSDRITAAQQRAFAKAYVLAFFRRYLGGETRFEAVLTGHVPQPASVAGIELFPSFHAPDALRLDVNRLLDDDALSTNDLGQSVSQSGLTPYTLCGHFLLTRAFCGESYEGPDGPVYHQPHAYTDYAFLFGKPAPGLSTLDLRWGPPGGGGAAYYRNNLPADTDLSDYYMLQFRAGVNFFDGPADAAQDFSVKLTDGTSASSSVVVSQFSNALFYPKGDAVLDNYEEFIRNYRKQILLNTISIPLTAFTGIDQTDVRSVEFVFDQENSQDDVEGAIYVSDIAFSSMPGVGDGDDDGVIDTEDNCSTLSNPTQCDTDQDGYGNHCDGDFDENEATNATDFGLFNTDFKKGVDSGIGSDMNCSSGVVNALDSGLFSTNFKAGKPGPSGLVCAGTVPCDL